jgi:hypothetical protein
MSDERRLKSLLEKLASMGMDPARAGDGWQYFINSDDELPRAVSLEDFFEGNPNTMATFASNLSYHPGEDAIYYLCKRLKTRSDVDDVFVGVSQIDYLDSEPDKWVYADTLYFVTTATPPDIKNWFGKLHPDEIYALNADKINARFGLPQPPAGHQIYVAWWD